MDFSILINKPKTKKGRETLDKIVSAAAQVFYEKGYHNSSINDITQCAGVASGTFYIYFDSKINLYKFLLLQCSHMIRRFLKEATKECRTRKEVEEVGLLEWLKFVRRNRYMYHIIWESLYIDKDLFRNYYQSFCKSYIQGLEEAKNRGDLNEDVDSAVLAWTLMGATNFLGLNWGLFNPNTNDLKDVTEKFMRILADDIFTDDVKPEIISGADEFEELPIKIEVQFEE